VLSTPCVHNTTNVRHSSYLACDEFSRTSEILQDYVDFFSLFEGQAYLEKGNQVDSVGFFAILPHFQEVQKRALDLCWVQKSRRGGGCCEEALTNVFPFGDTGDCRAKYFKGMS
jgi:hypothetical protein